MNEWQLTEDEIISLAGDHETTALAAQKKLVAWLDIQLKLSSPETTTGWILNSVFWHKFCESLGVVGYETK